MRAYAFDTVVNRLCLMSASMNPCVSCTKSDAATCRLVRLCGYVSTYNVGRELQSKHVNGCLPSHGIVEHKLTVGLRFELEGHACSLVW